MLNVDDSLINIRGCLSRQVSMTPTWELVSIGARLLWIFSRPPWFIFEKFFYLFHICIFLSRREKTISEALFSNDYLVKYGRVRSPWEE